MSPLRARVEKGRLVLDEPTTLPEGTLSTWLLTTKGMTSPRTSAARCMKRCRRPGNPLTPAGFGQRRRFWTSCPSGGDSAMSSTPPSVVDAFRTTLDLFETGLDLMRQNLRRSHPETGDEEIELLLHEWLLDRPGAESGDCPGRPVDVNTRLA